MGICAAEIPDLLGYWVGTGPGYNEDAGYVDEADYGNVSFSITEQQGRIFAGNMTYQMNGSDVVEGFAGAIGADNQTLYIAEFGTGYDLGTVISDDEIEIIYMQDGDPAEIFVQILHRAAE